jgi:glycosyltransferase involved in cell wall biosynthesis
MKFTVNGRFRNQRTTGVQRYAREITARLAHLVDIVTPRKWSAGVRGHVWEQSVLPRLARGGLLWSPCNTGPLSVERQVVTIHDCAFIDHSDAFSRLFATWYQWLIPRLARRARRVITVSKFSANRLAEFCRLDASRIEVIPNGVDARFRPSTPEAIAELRNRLALPERFVLSVGSLEPRKNLRRLLDAWEQVRRTSGNVGLVLAGGERRVFRDAGLERVPAGVHLAGYVVDADLPTLYAAAEVFVYPSLYEGFGLTVLESMACGTPVVCSRTTSLPEVAGDAALYVDPLDTASIGSAIERLLANGALQNAQRARGLERAARFSWDQTAAATAGVLQQAAAA